MKNIITFLCRIMALVLFLISFLCAIAFVANLLVPKTIDNVAEVGFLDALGINVVLPSIFALQHSSIRRPGLKR